ncbi:hypothetical protein JCM10207_007740, partial [Rhodosporidiobolus poonsookiae]
TFPAPQCIGRRNYTPFLAFLLAAVLSAIYSISFSAWHIWRRSVLDPDGWSTHWDTIGAFVVCILSFGLLVPVGGLASYHARLVWTNRTTIEMLRPLASRSASIDPATGAPLPGNLWAHSTPWANCVAGACRPMQYESAIMRREWAGRDAREEAGKAER